ncbi:MAG: magnesium and cobalt transport protein CorA [Nakamurella sp.]
MPRLPSLPPIFPHGRHPQKPAPTQVERVPSLVDCAAYVDGHRVDDCSGLSATYAAVQQHGSGFAWVGLYEPSAEDMEEVAEVFGLHRLAVEDAVTAHQRPKLERYKRYSVLVIKTVEYVDHESSTTAVEIVNTGEILLLIGPDFIITVRHGRHSELKGIRASLEEDHEHLALGPAAVAHTIADRIVDHYLTVIGEVEDDVDEMESLVFDTRSSVRIEQIYLLKREILELRRAVVPLGFALEQLIDDDSPLFPLAVRAYFRDVADHLKSVVEQVWTFDELLNTLVSARLANVTTRQNEDMRKISAWAAIALVPTAIAGIYGMNFDHMPELRWTFGYPMAVGFMVLVCVLLFRMLRKRGWL